MIVPPSWKKQIEVWHLIVSLAVIVLGVVFSGAATYIRAQDDHQTLKLLQDKVEATSIDRDRQMARLERNVIRIADKVGASVEYPKD